MVLPIARYWITISELTNLHSINNENCVLLQNPKMLPSLALAVLLLLHHAGARELVDIKSEFLPLKNTVVVIGPWRSGKDELVKTMSMDNTKFRTIRTHDGDLHLVDNDENFVDNSMDNFHYPVLFKDGSTLTNFYLCPRFDSSRLSMIDFVVDYFTTKMLKSVASIKYVFVIDWNYLQTGNSTTPSGWSLPTRSQPGQIPGFNVLGCNKSSGNRS